MDTAGLRSSPSSNAGVSRSEGVQLNLLNTVTCGVSVGASAARPFGGAIHQNCVDRCESPKPAGGRSLGPARFCGCGVVAFLTVLCIALTAWNVRMALSLTQVGHDAISTNASGTAQRRLDLTNTIQQQVAYARASQPSGQAAKTNTLAHLGSDYYPSPEPEPSYRHVNRWLNGSRYGSIVEGNVSNAGGGVTIGESGYYFVYSQVSYVLAVPDAGKVLPFTDHKLIRRRAASQSGGDGSVGGDVLARSQKARCWSSQYDASFMSSYVGAVFHLDKGDVLTVDVDRVRYVWHSPEQTFVGVYLLPS